MLTLIAWCSLGLASLCGLLVLIDLIRRPQKMAVMNVVWPITALYFSVFAVWGYYSFGRAERRDVANDASAQPMAGRQSEAADRGAQPTLAQVAKGTSHCGAGCTIADVGTEFAIAATGFTLFASSLATSYVLDFIVAWMVGIIFQYFAMRPMRPELSPARVILSAIKADTLSILAFQIGMYAFMALVHYKLFPAPHLLTAFDPRYWLMMQVAMICGFATSLPMNRALISWGWKEAM